MSDAETAIATESLTKIYQGRQIALNCVDLRVEAGTVLGVLGQNGAGKTTLVKLLLGLQVPTAGRAFVLGRRMSPNASALRRKIGYLPADPRFPHGMTPIDYLDYVGRLCALPGRIRRPRLAALLRAVDLLPVAGQKIQKSSTGMKTRLAIAASLINDPDLLIWDEPSQGLDAEARRSMLELMKNLAEAKTLVLCTHHLRDVQEVCHQSIVLHDGQIVFDGDLDQLSESIKPSCIEIAIAGERRDIAEAVKSLQQLEELESCTIAKNRLAIQIQQGTSHATALANVLVTLSDRNLEMIDLRIAGQQTEQAIVNLLVQEGNRGLTRAYQPVEA